MSLAPISVQPARERGLVMGESPSPKLTIDALARRVREERALSLWFDDRRRLLALCDLDGLFVEVNAYATTRFGYPRDELVNVPIWELPAFRRDAAWKQTWQRRLQQALDGGETSFEDPIALTGSPRHVTCTRVTVLRGDDDEPIGFGVEAEDITQARDAQALAREQQRLLQLVFEQSFQRAVILSPSGIVRELNTGQGLTDAFERDDVIGRSVGKVAARTSRDQPATVAMWEERLLLLREAEGPQRYLDVVEGQDGTVEQALDVVLTPMRDEHGSMELILLELRDDTERHVAEQRLRLSEERLRVLIDSIPHLVWSADRSGAVDYLSADWSRYTGRRVTDLLQQQWLSVVHPDDREAVTQAWTQAQAVGTYEMTYRMRRFDGVYRWFETVGSATFDQQRLARWFGAVLDITERREAQEREAEQQERLRSALEVSGLGSYVLSLRPGTPHVSDPQMNELAGFDLAAVFERDGFDPGFLEHLHPEDRGRLRQVVVDLDDAPPETVVRADYRFMRTTGGGTDERQWSVFGRLDRDEEGPVRLIGVVADVTEARRTADARLRSQKLDAIGTLASGLAHDINNVLGAILSYARVAEAEIQAGESPDESVAEIARGALRAGEIVQRLLAFARHDEPVRQAFELALVVDEAVSLLRPTLPPDVSVTMEIAPNLPRLHGDPTQVHQLIVNLLTNAIQAVDGAGGAVHVAVRSLSSTRHLQAEFPELDDGPCLELDVTDDGPGIDPLILKRLFDPFFTTKAPGQGTGLGLAAVESVVQNHRGAIGVTSLPEHGTTFRVFFPLSSATRVDPPDVVSGSSQRLRTGAAVCDPSSAQVRRLVGRRSRVSGAGPCASRRPRRLRAQRPQACDTSSPSAT